MTDSWKFLPSVTGAGEEAGTLEALSAVVHEVATVMCVFVHVYVEGGVKVILQGPCLDT